MTTRLVRTREEGAGYKASHVLVDRPGRDALLVRCRDIDECLRVVEGELKYAPVGSVVSIMRERGKRLWPVASWKVHPSGARRFRVNPEDAE